MKFSLSSGLIASLFLINVTEARWKPAQGDTWNYVLEESVDVSNEPAEIVDVDYKTNSAIIEKIHAAGKKVICYFSGGTLEDFRKDKDQFYEINNLVRNAYEDWAGENWLDIRKEGLKPLMKNRMKEAIDKKCDALEVDNLDGWQQDEVKTWSNPLTLKDTITYAKWLGETAHDMGISIGLKNGLFMIDDVSDYFDFAINESCATLPHPECHLYKNFLNKGKAVLGISYQTYLDYDYEKLCNNINGLGISMIIKETQTLKQAGSIFDGKKKCGSNFSQPFKNSSSSDSTPKQITTTVVKTTTTTTVKPIITFKKVEEVKQTTTTTTVKPTTTTVIIKPTTTSVIVKPITHEIIKPTTTTQVKIIKPTTTTQVIIKPTTTVNIKPNIVKETAVKPITNVTLKPIMTADKQMPQIDIIATTTLKATPVQKVASTEKPNIINKSANVDRPTTVNQDMTNIKSEMPLGNNSNYNSHVYNNEQELLRETNKKPHTNMVIPTLARTFKAKPTTSFEQSKGQDSKVDAMIEAQKEMETTVDDTKEKETKADIEEENEKLNDDKMINNDKSKVDGSKSKSKSGEKSKEVNGVDEESSGTGTAVVAFTGSVVGAAGVFLLIKKNPKKYESLKRGLSRRATSVKRSASTISRRLTNKKAKDSNESLNESYNSYNNSYDNLDLSSNYRYNFSQNYNFSQV